MIRTMFDLCYIIYHISYIIYHISYIIYLSLPIWICMNLPLVPAGGGAEVAFRFDYKTFVIYRTCMRRAPTRCWSKRACELAAVLLSKNMTCALSRCNATPSERFLHTSHCTFHSPHFTLHTSHSTIHLISSHLISSRIIWFLLTSCHLISALLISSHPFSHVIWVSSSQLFSSHPSTEESSSQLNSGLLRARKDLTVAAKSFAQKNIKRTRLRHTEAWDTDAFTQKIWTHTLYYKACTKYFPVPSTSQYHFVLQSLHKVPPSTTLYYKACTEHFPVPLCTTKLAQNTFQYYFGLQSLHRALPSTTLYYKACTKYFPVLLWTTKLAQSTFQYFFVPQSLHKALPSTFLYYKACAKYFPVLFCATKLAQSTSQYHFVLHSLHKVLPSTSLYYTACTKYVPLISLSHTSNCDVMSTHTPPCIEYSFTLLIMMWCIVTHHSSLSKSHPQLGRLLPNFLW